jgi:hypothetical protein
MPLRDGRPPQLPALSDFLLSPGFAGALVVLAAVLMLLAALMASRRTKRQLLQQDRHHQEILADKSRREKIDRCWDRLVWLIRTASMDPAAVEADEQSLGLGPELTLSILEGLQSDAADLRDNTLSRAVAVYLTQYGLVLAQRIGPLPDTLVASIGGSDPIADGGHNGEPPENLEKTEFAAAKASANQRRT